MSKEQKIKRQIKEKWQTRWRRVIFPAIIMLFIIPLMAFIFHNFVIYPYLRNMLNTIFMHYKQAIYFTIANTEGMNAETKGNLYSLCKGTTFPIIIKEKLRVSWNDVKDITPATNPEKIIQQYNIVSITILMICIAFCELVMLIYLKWVYGEQKLITRSR